MRTDYHLSAFDDDCPQGENCTHDLFKCRDCGLKYSEKMSSINDIAVCTWCNDEEVKE